MNPTTGGRKDRQKETATEIARKKVLAAYALSSDANKMARAPEKIEKIEKVENTENTPTSKPALDRKKTYRHLGRVADRLFTSVTRPVTPVQTSTTTYKDAPINAKSTGNIAGEKDNVDWQKYHSAWQWYYQQYYSEYYAKAANNYIEEERTKLNEEAKKAAEKATREEAEKAAKKAARRRMKKAVNPDQATDPTDEEEQSILTTLKERIRDRARKEAKYHHKYQKFIPIIAGIVAVLIVLFLQYNRLVFAPLMAYVSPGNTSDSGITEIDPTITKAVGPDNRLIIPKLNVDVPVHFGISNDTDTINAAMEDGVAQFSVPGASALPGQIGNLVITGHSAGDIYSNNQYKFIFSGLERLSDGDLIYIDYGGTRYTYSVTKKETVEPNNVSALVYPTSKPILTLITCTPLGTSRYRLLVTAEQINPTPSGVTQEYVDDNSSNSEEVMPQNEPTFFERIWNWLTGN